MSNITDLRKHLFDALRGLSDKSIDIDHAKAIADVSQTIINSVKAETEYLRVTGQSCGTGFITEQLLPGTNPPVVPSMASQIVGANIRVHRIKG